MPLDSNIPLQSRLNPNPVSLSEMMALGQSMRQRRQENEANRKKGTLQSMLQANIELGPEGPKLNKQGFLTGLARAGMSEEALQFQGEFQAQEDKRLEGLANRQRMVNKRLGEVTKDVASYVDYYNDPKEIARELKSAYDREGLPHNIGDEVSQEQWEAMKKKHSGASQDIAGQVYFDAEGKPNIASRDPSNPFTIPLTTRGGGEAPRSGVNYTPKEIEIDGKKFMAGFDPRTNQISISPLVPSGNAPVGGEKKVIGATPSGASDEAEKLKMEKERLRLQRERDRIDAEKAALAAKGSSTQFIAAGFAQRIRDANKAMDALYKEGFDRASAESGVASALPNYFQGDDVQSQSQAERNFVNAVLRRESGAAIGVPEFKSAEKQYFPRAGDGEKVLKQKEQARKQAFANLRAEAGDSAWGEIEKAKGSTSGLTEAQIKRRDELRKKKAEGTLK